MRSEVGDEEFAGEGESASEEGYGEREGFCTLAMWSSLVGTWGPVDVHGIHRVCGLHYIDN